MSDSLCKGRHREPVELDRSYTLCGGPVAEPGGVIRWTGCTGRLRRTLLDLADVLDDMDVLLVTPTPSDGNERRLARAEGQAPCRLDVVDLRDERSDTPALRILSTVGLIVARARGLSTFPSRPGDQARLMVRHLEWLSRYEFAHEVLADISDVWRWVRSAAGLQPPPPVFACPVVLAGAEGECGGPVYPARYAFAVRCSRCGSEWDGDEQLRWLGLVAGR